jgi:tetratricopeptide (TPR) repeat protein
VGRTLNLSAGLDTSDYGDRMGTEFLHPGFDYQVQHCWAVGYIERPLAADFALPHRRACPAVGAALGGARRLWTGHPAVSTGSTTASDEAVVRWLARFREQPLEALDRTLTRRAHLGPFNTLPASVALGQMIADPGQTLDTVMLRWLREHWRKTEVAGLRLRRYAEALAEALRAVDLLGLPESLRWLRQHAPGDYRWLRTLQVGGPATPLDALFATLASTQPDRALETFWLRLSRLDGQTPVSFGRVALTGLRLLPPREPGRPAPEPALYGGLVHFAEGLARRGAGPDALADEIGYLCALQSLSPAALGRPLRKALKQQLQDPKRGLSADARAWLESAVPSAFKDANHLGVDICSPMPADLRAVVDRIQRDGLDKTRDAVNRLIAGHRQYYEQTGDGYYLVRCFERLSKTLRDAEPTWARDLAHEALRIEPSDHHNWSALALALDAAGDWTRASDVFWHARRRFPQNPFAHTQLGQALLRHGEDTAALAAYAEAARRFPGNPVAIAGHGHALLELDGPDAALPVLWAGVEAHPSNLPLRGALTDALIQAGNVPEAERQLAAAQQIERAGRPDPRVAQVAERLDLAKQGHLPDRHRQEPPEGPAGDPGALADVAGNGLADARMLGESTLFRHAGRHEQRRQIVDRLPTSPEGDAERGLWIAVNDGWAAASAWWQGRNTLEQVTHIHALRCQHRAGELVNWGQVGAELPAFAPVIHVIAGQEVGEIQVTEKSAEDLKRDAWLFAEVHADERRRDKAEEDWLAAAQVI